MGVRPAETSDARALTAIYNYEVVNGVNNYVVDIEDVSTREEWIRNLKSKGFPIFVFERNNEVIAFGALTPFHGAAGYKTTVSGVLYVHHQHHRQRVAQAIGESLIEKAKKLGVHCIIAGINSENDASISFHQSFGFRQVGFFKDIAFKHGRFHSDVCMQLFVNNKD